MLVRTHIVISLFVGLVFLNVINDKLIFLTTLLIATMLPDIDNGDSYISHKLGIAKKIFLLFSRHRGFLHSLTCCIAIAVIIALFFPKIALPFFIGYSLHILADSFTSQGIKAFLPYKKDIRGMIMVGGFAEKVIFSVFILLDILIIAAIIF